MRLTLFFSALFSILFSFFFTSAWADHALPFNPSFYPHEIQIKTVDLNLAKRLLSNNSLHAYIGGNPFAGSEPPPHIGYVESFDSYLVVTFNLASKLWEKREARCAAVGPLMSAMAANKGNYIFHPYPVTPYHEDYLQHFDLAESAKNSYRTESSQVSAVNLKIHTKGSVAEKIVHSMSRVMKGGD